MSAFQLMFGQAAVAQLRAAVGERSSFALALPVATLSQFAPGTAANNLQDLINSLVPNIRDGLTSAEFAELLAVLVRQPNGLSGQQTRDLVWELCPNPSGPHDLGCKQTRALLLRLCRTPPGAAVHDELTPIEARNLIHDLVVTPPMPIAPARVRELMRCLFIQQAAGAGGAAFAAENPISVRDARTFIRALLAGPISPFNIHALVTVCQQNPGNLRVPPTFLRDVHSQSVNPPDIAAPLAMTFAQVLAGAIQIVEIGIAGVR